MLELDTLLQPISDAAPCGPELRSDLAFRDIEEAPVRFKDMAPDELKATVRSCAELLGQTKDQLPAIVALQAAARLSDLDMMIAALKVLHHLVADHWDAYHPGPADEMLIARSNELAVLSRPAALGLPLDRMVIVRLPAPLNTEINWAMLQQACEPTPKWGDADDQRIAKQVESGQITQLAARAQRLVRESGRQLRMIARALSAEARAADLQASADDGEAPAIDPAQLVSAALAIRERIALVRDQFQAVSDLFYEVSEAYERRSGETPAFGPVLAQLRSMIGACDKFLTVFPAPAGDAPVIEATAGEMLTGTGGVSPVPGHSTAFTPGEMRNRNDVLAAIDAICRYYAEAEPGSPVPLMLRRVRSWVTLDFIGLMEEIAPDEIDHVRKLLAVPSESEG